MTLGLHVENLNLNLGDQYILKNVNLHLNPSETLCFVGESGSGKTMTVLTILGLSPLMKNVQSGLITLETDGHKKAFTLGPKLNLNKLWNFYEQKVSLILQDSKTSLNPYKKVHNHFPDGLNSAKKWLERVRISDVDKVCYYYPHQLSGGMAQRVQIALALAKKSNLLIADEPTTGLDSSVQAEIIELFKEIKEEGNCSMIFITHDLDLVKNLGDRVSVLYKGEMIEHLSCQDLLDMGKPKHPYTMELLGSKRRLADIKRKRLDLEYRIGKRKNGSCVYYHRCPFVIENTISGQKCKTESPKCYRLSHEHTVRCWEYFRE